MNRILRLCLGSVLAAIGVMFLVSATGFKIGFEAGLGVLLLIPSVYMLKQVFMPDSGSSTRGWES